MAEILKVMNWKEIIYLINLFRLDIKLISEDGICLVLIFWEIKKEGQIKKKFLIKNLLIINMKF